jgi:hypothetical protein
MDNKTIEIQTNTQFFSSNSIVEENNYGILNKKNLFNLNDNEINKNNDPETFKDSTNIFDFKKMNSKSISNFDTSKYSDGFLKNIFQKQNKILSKESSNNIFESIVRKTCLTKFDIVKFESENI